MAEENQTEPEVKTAMDLKLEEMQKQLSDMQAKYETQVKELTEANNDLWAACHPVKDEGRTYVAEPVKNENLRPQADVLNEMVRKKLGITE